LSGPLVDRIDLHVTLSPIPLSDLGRTGRAESSAAIRDRVECARNRQRQRHDRTSPVACKARMSGRTAVAMLGTDARQLLESAGATLDLSARAYHRLAKVARTIADLASEECVAAEHVAEALRYRPIQVRRG
jgi:magnesium chelatase family protein